MMAPWLPDSAGFVALPIGFAFGAALERAGLGSAKTIADQLRGRDFTVVKVMFAAIITAMLGVFWASRLGWLDLSQVGVPETDLVPQLIGAVLFGAGFSVASLCPGTACVAAGAGHRDGLAAIGGLFVGTLLTMLVWPDLGAAAVDAPRPEARLAGDLGWSPGVVVAVIAIGGVVVLWFAGRLEQGRAEAAPEDRASRRFFREIRLTPLAGATIGLGLLAGFAREGPAVDHALLASLGAEIAAERDHLDPLVLAEWLRSGLPGLRVIDVREPTTELRYRIPGSEAVPIDQLAGLAIAPNESVVLYSDGGTHAAQAWVILRARTSAKAGRVLVLRDGLAGWEDEVLSPHPPLKADSAAMARFQRIKELSLWFGGLPSSTPQAATAAPTVPSRRRNRC